MLISERIGLHFEFTSASSWAEAQDAVFTR